MSNIRLLDAYGYRSAMVKGVFLTLPREYTRELEKELNDQGETPTDNHTTFTFEDGKRHRIIVTFTDGHTMFGSRIAIGNW